MTNWLPDLAGGTGPLYQRLADRIEADIDTGSLPHGTRLPPQRDLAFDIRTTVGTIGRAYALLRERGLVNGEVGRGTYVTGKASSMKPAAAIDGERHNQRSVPPDAPDAHVFGTRLADVPAGIIRFDSTSAIDVGQGATIAKMLGEAALQTPDGLTNYVRSYPRDWFEAGSRWLARNAYQPRPETIVPTLGVHAGIMAIVSAVTSPGDYLVFDHLTYAPVSRSAGLAGRRIALVEADEHGMIAEDLDRVCAQKHPKMACLMPTLHNPTLTTMPEARRREIAEVARKHNLLLLEDDLYGNLSDDPTPLLADFAPERTFVASGLSKAVAAGIRGGWVSAPPAYTNRIRVAHRLQAGAMPFILAEASARLVMSGEADDIRVRSIAEIQARIGMVNAALDGHKFNAHPNIPFVWVALPGTWTPAAFKTAALNEGLLIDDEDEFKAGRSDKVFHRVRFAISATLDRATVAHGLSVLRRLLDEGPVGFKWFD